MHCKTNMKKEKYAIIVTFAVLAVFIYLIFRYQDIGFYIESKKRADVNVKNVEFDADGLKLVGKIMLPVPLEENKKYPAFILLHGTSPHGMNLFLYKRLSIELVKKGFIVFIYNQRGYDTSPDPQNNNGHYDLNFIEDAVHAANFLRKQPDVNPSMITLLGHSFGASVAVGVSHVSNVEKLFNQIVIISPGRGWVSKGEGGYSFRQKRLTEDMKLEETININMIKSFFRKVEVETLINRKSIIPIKLINGEYEEKDKPLTNIFKNMPEPKDIRIIQGTGHYFHTTYSVNQKNLPFKIYKKSILSELIKAILE